MSRRWIREPLVHFIAIGAVLFALDAILVARKDDPRTIVMDEAVDQEARRIFTETRGHAPDAAELRALRQVWLDNEVLYREGLALGLDRGDNAIRERVIFKALSMVDSGTRLPAYDEALLQQWFERNRARYDEPARYDFHEAVLAGDASEAAVLAFVEALNGGKPPDVEAGLRVFKARPQPTIVHSYGEEFANRLAGLARGQWHAMPSREGWRAIRIEAVTAAQAADFEQLRGRVLQDWTDETLAAQRSAAVKSIAARYRILVPGQ
jgi:hypothetical protein